MTPEENLAYLNQQRAIRPSSPWHIYQPQLTSMSSIANRATGAFLSAGASCSPGFISTSSARPFCSILAPLIGCPRLPHRLPSPPSLSLAQYVRATGFYGIMLSQLAGVDSAALLDTFASLPGWMQLTAKAAIAGPAAYHTLNGFRHLGWDLGYFLNLKSSYMAGYAVIGASAVSTVALLSL
ncbi:SPOSA6832_04827 [Sporobolomyces salmonicolor]|uniref:SPOSA6832_04827-mRNA-1:cds n=1 Tax=Sporidiobolus salmonicolor TaxID=5005 RepID=A0A0D6ESZ2_SPOSA|nr:SPOSA6832_04827 [Sporobolomyces salmonicolor]